MHSADRDDVSYDLAVALNGPSTLHKWVPPKYDKRSLIEAFPYPNCKSLPRGRAHTDREMKVV